MAPRELTSKFGYGAIFVLAWPALLATWAQRLDQLRLLSWPPPLPPILGGATLASGILLMGIAMRALWVHGGGLPMNAFPPKRRVERSAYRLFAHPIYVGHALAVFGAAALAGSGAGFWIVAPVATAATVALTLGYEGRDLVERLGPPRARPLFSLAADDTAPASVCTRVVAAVAGFGLWAGVYAMLSQMPAPGGTAELRFAAELAWPHPAWSLWPYSAAYPFVALCPLALATNQEARRCVLGIWVASAVGFAAMLLLPGQAAWLPLQPAADTLLALNRALDADWLARPSFHAAWSLVAAAIYARRWPQWRIPACAAALVIAASCIATGAHALVDVLWAVPLAAVAIRFHLLARAVVQASERIANSWRAWHIGPVRVISHAPWTAAAAVAGTLAAAWLAGPGQALPLALVLAAGLGGALLFGRLVEGRHLSRPFGYFGFLIASLAALAALTVIDRGRGVLVATALAAAAPLAQAIGRGRCLVQGCCHGGRDPGPLAITVTHPMSRICAVADLCGVRIRPIQLMSAISGLVIAAVLMRLWAVAAPASLICGLYLVLTGLCRFAEEGSRAEPQTPVMSGLSIYQWLSLIAFVAGIGLTMIASAPVHPALTLDAASVAAALAVGAASTLAMSIDWPDTKLPMSRLAPPDPAPC